MAFCPTGRRSYGVVSHSTKSFGFIEVLNNAAIPSVFFDHQSFMEQRGCDLTVQYPKGTSVSFNIIPTNGEHKVKYRAFNGVKQNNAPRSNASAPLSLERALRNMDHYLTDNSCSNAPLLSSPRRVLGNVNHCTDNYGFISVKDRSLSISTVYFDHKSFLRRESGNLSLKYGKGTLVSFIIVPTSGEHKKKHRAANIIKENCSSSANSSDPPRSATEKSSIGKACKRFLTKHLMENGAEVIEVLINHLSDDDDCPAALRNPTMDKIIQLARENANILVVKNSSLCLVEMEERVAEVFKTAMEKYGGRMVMSQVNGVFSSQGDTRIYLYAKGDWQNGVKDYIARNPSDLIHWDDQIWTKEFMLENEYEYETFQNNLKAVKYFSQFVLGKVVTVASLGGHIAQASPAIKSYVSVSRSDFPDFLSKNSFFFAVNDDEVECSTHRMAVLDRYWLKDKRNRNRAKTKNVKPVCKSPPPSPMKAFCETGFVSSPKTAVACSDQNDIYTFMDKKRDNAASETLPDSFLRLTTSTPSIFSTSEEKAFSELLGKETASSLEKEMQSRNLSSLNDLILLRFHLGKQPRVKLFDSSCSSVINCTLTNSGTIDGSVIQNILGNKGLLKQLSGVRYAVKNTLHSVRISEENGKTTGLTVFCQIHGKCSNEIDVIQRKKFTAVVSDISKFPAKYVYNILRNRCCELSRDNDVLLLDVDGQLSGLDDKPHSSVGTEVHRVLCSSSELPEKIRDAIQLFHDYVILINVDDRDILQLVFKMCSRGINVIAEVPSELRNEIDRIFTS